MTIRRAVAADLPRIWEIRRGVRENRLSRREAIADEEVRWFLDGPGIWVWEAAGAILGFSAGDTRNGTVWALFVDPEHEGRGIGRALFRKAWAVLREAGHERLRLSTENGTRAERFYRAQGWQPLKDLATGEVLLEAPSSSSGRHPG